MLGQRFRRNIVSSVAQKTENSQKIAATTAATGSLTDLMEQSEMKAECSSCMRMAQEESCTED